MCVKNTQCLHLHLIYFDFDSFILAHITSWLLSNVIIFRYNDSKDWRITPDEYKENKDRYDKEIARIQQQMNRLEEADNNFYLTATYLLQLFEHGDKLFEVANIEEKRELLQLVLSNLKLNAKTVRFTPNEPFATVLKLSECSAWQEWRDSNPRHLVLETSALATWATLL